MCLGTRYHVALTTRDVHCLSVAHWIPHTVHSSRRTHHRANIRALRPRRVAVRHDRRHRSLIPHAHKHALVLVVVVMGMTMVVFVLRRCVVAVVVGSRLVKVRVVALVGVSLRGVTVLSRLRVQHHLRDVAFGLLRLAGAAGTAAAQTDDGDNDGHSQHHKENDKVREPCHRRPVERN